MRRLVAIAGLAVALASCAGLPGSEPAALHVEPRVQATGLPLYRDGRPLRIAVAEFTDARPAAGTRGIGKLRATVRDMFGTELALDRDVAALVAEATRAQLAADGYPATSAEADLTLAGTVNAFSLDVGGRDERYIAVELALRDVRSGQSLWSGRIEERDDRYAGVTGNSRATLTAYLEEGVANYAARAGAALRENLRRIYPDARVDVAPARQPTVPGVTALQPPVPQATAPAAVASPAPASVPTPATGPAPVAANGHFAVRTVPPRVRVYVGDVYHGMTPLRLELPAGVANITLKLGGYRSLTEKVSIRSGETTELELTLDRQ